MFLTRCSTGFAVRKHAQEPATRELALSGFQRVEHPAVPKDVIGEEVKRQACYGFRAQADIRRT